MQSARQGKGLGIKGSLKSVLKTRKINDNSQFSSSTSPTGSFPHSLTLTEGDQPYPSKLRRWGYWNDLEKPNGEAQLKEERRKAVHSERGEKSCAHGTFLKLISFKWPMHWSTIKKRQSLRVAGLFSNASKELPTLHSEEHLNEKPETIPQLENWTPDFSCEKVTTKDISVFGKLRRHKELPIKETSECFGGAKLSVTPKRKASVQNELSDEGTICNTPPTYPPECKEHCASSTETSRKKKISSTHSSQTQAVDLEALFSELITSSNNSIMHGTACGMTVSGGTCCTGTSALEAPITLRNFRFISGNAPNMSSARYDDNFTSLNAKMDSRFEQVLEAIDIIAAEVRRNAELQQENFSLTTDAEDSDQSMLISSKSSEIGTTDMKLLPLKIWVPQSELLETPAVRELKGAVDDAQFKMRVLAGLLIAEQNAKMASANNFKTKNMILNMGMIGAQMLEGEVLLAKPWHIKYVLDCCMGSIFFGGPHGSSHCICCKPHPACFNYPSYVYDLSCNDIELSSMTFDSLCDDATVAIEELAGRRTKDWSEALTNMFWSCAASCFFVHKLTNAILKSKAKIQILHPGRNTSFESSAMDPLDSENLETFHKKIHFTIFSGFMLEGKVLCRSQVYLEPNLPLIRL